MSEDLPERPASPAAVHSVAIVASEYNAIYVDALVKHAVDELEIIAPGAVVTIHRVPGAYEIPLAVQTVAQSRAPAVIIAFGVIIEGETAHADLIARCVTDAFMKISLETEIPVIHEVLLVQNQSQAERRCLKEDLNRGIEAARTAVTTVEALRRILSD